MHHATAIVALAGLAAAAKVQPYSGKKLTRSSNLLPGVGSQALVLAATAICDVGESECDGGCMPSTGECCDLGIGAYCDPGTYCVTNGCCEDGEICTGEASGCNDGKVLCGDFCIPSDGECCDDILGDWCESGTTCDGTGFCETGGSSGGSSGGSDDTSSDTGSSGDCYSFQEECGDGCMPEGSNCCNDGTYCFSFETCNGDGTCSTGSGSGSSGGDTSTEDDDTSSDDTSSDTGSDSDDTSTSSDDTSSDDTSSDDTSSDDTTEDDSSSSGGSGGGRRGGGGSSGDDASDAALTLPSLLVGAIALLPLFN